MEADGYGSLTCSVNVGITEIDISLVRLAFPSTA